MPLKDALLPEFDHEMANTRKSLERVPEDKFGWKPHEKSGTMGWLSAHLADIPAYVPVTLAQDSFDIAPQGEHPQPAKPPATRSAILEAFDKNVAAARAAIAGAEDRVLMQPWSLLSGGKVVFTMPKIAVLRGFVMSHTIHHRAQLGVYLRLNNLPVPSIYGPSADETGM
jgi:uncharacterized damage-inducible protein DinB